MRARALARYQKRICDKRFIRVQHRVPRDPERACQRARGGKARSREQRPFENRLPQLIVDWWYIGQPDCGSILRAGVGGFAGRFKLVPFAVKVALYQLPFSEEHCNK